MEMLFADRMAILSIHEIKEGMKLIWWSGCLQSHFQNRWFCC